MYIVITIDTEADNQWDPTARQTVRNLAYVPRFQRLCERFGFPVTYLCTYEVAGDPMFTSERGFRGWQDRGTAEVGAHLHPWSTPPLAPETGDHAPTPRPYPSELERGDFVQKMRTLTHAITRGCGRRPTSYRAGRWGFSAEHVGALLELGYEVDCSVTPMTSWRDHPGAGGGDGPDFRRCGVEPYRLDPLDLSRHGVSGLIEAPVTIVPGSWVERRWALARRWSSAGVVGRIGRRAGLWRGPRWYRPWPHHSAADLARVYDTAEAMGLPLVEMMFHSSELMPGGSPFYPDPASVERLYATLEGTFAHAADRGAIGVTLTEFARRWSRGVAVPARAAA